MSSMAACAGSRRTSTARPARAPSAALCGTALNIGPPIACDTSATALSRRRSSEPDSGAAPDGEENGGFTDSATNSDPGSGHPQPPPCQPYPKSKCRCLKIETAGRRLVEANLKGIEQSRGACAKPVRHGRRSRR